MSYGIMPYAVKLARVQRAFGSRDAVLVSDVTGEFEEIFDRDDCDADDPDEPTLEEALHEIVEGRPLREGYGHKYGYALKLLCEHLGKPLPNVNFSGMHSVWIEEVDQGLIQAGVPDETFGLGRHLTYRGSPIAIPRPDDFPFIGFLRAPEVGPALRALRAANLTRLSPEVREAVAELTGWLDLCSRSATDLVCFYH